MEANNDECGIHYVCGESVPKIRELGWEKERRNEGKSERSYSIVYTGKQRLIASETIERKKRE